MFFDKLPNVTTSLIFKAGQSEMDDGRLSRPVLGEREGETPSRHSTHLYADPDYSGDVYIQS